ARLRERLDQATRRLDDARRDRADAVRALEEIALPDGGLPGTLLPSLRARLEELRAAERDAADAEREIEAARRALDEERRTIGSAVGHGRLALRDAAGMDALGTCARDADRVEPRAPSLEAELRAQGEEEPPADLDALR